LKLKRWLDLVALFETPQYRHRWSKSSAVFYSIGSYFPEKTAKAFSSR